MHEQGSYEPWLQASSAQEDAASASCKRLEDPCLADAFSVGVVLFGLLGLVAGFLELQSARVPEDGGAGLPVVVDKAGSLVQWLSVA